MSKSVSFTNSSIGGGGGVVSENGLSLHTEISRRPGFVAVVWLAPPPPPRPISYEQVISLSQSFCVMPFSLSGGRGGGRWGEPIHMTTRKPGPLSVIQYSLVIHMSCRSICRFSCQWKSDYHKDADKIKYAVFCENKCLHIFPCFFLYLQVHFV